MSLGAGRPHRDMAGDAGPRCRACRRPRSASHATVQVGHHGSRAAHAVLAASEEELYMQACSTRGVGVWWRRRVWTPCRTLQADGVPAVISAWRDRGDGGSPRWMRRRARTVRPRRLDDTGRSFVRQRSTLQRCRGRLTQQVGTLFARRDDGEDIAIETARTHGARTGTKSSRTICRPASGTARRKARALGVEGNGSGRGLLEVFRAVRQSGRPASGRLYQVRPPAGGSK